MKLYKENYPVKDEVRRATKKWYVMFRDHNSKKRKLALFIDKKASTECARKIEQLVAYRISGERPDET